jgi:hypothetical protein
MLMPFVLYGKKYKMNPHAAPPFGLSWSKSFSGPS